MTPALPARYGISQLNVENETELFVARGAHDEPAGDAEQQKKGKKGVIALLLAAVSAVVAVLAKKKRDHDLDESLWDEPRSL
ncbi:MAG: hypothetical protein WD360_06330 [Nitriliruptoraceae bacterium]